MDIGIVLAFLGVDLLLVLTPGADWSYAIAAGLRGRAIVPAVAGLVGGYAGHTVLVVAGLAVLVAARPGLLTALTVLGAAYLIWLGGGILRGATGPQSSLDALAPSMWRVALRGAGVSGLNPKGLLLYLALLPQFVRPAAGWPVPVQTAVFGTLHMTNCAVVYLFVGVLAHTLLRAQPGAARVVSTSAGVAMIVVGGFLLVERIVASVHA